MAIKAPPGLKSLEKKVIDPISKLKDFFSGLSKEDLKIIRNNWSEIQNFVESEIQRK